MSAGRSSVARAGLAGALFGGRCHAGRVRWKSARRSEIIGGFYLGAARSASIPVAAAIALGRGS